MKVANVLTVLKQINNFRCELPHKLLLDFEFGFVDPYLHCGRRVKEADVHRGYRSTTMSGNCKIQTYNSSCLVSHSSAGKSGSRSFDFATLLSSTSTCTFLFFFSMSPKTSIPIRQMVNKDVTEIRTYRRTSKVGAK